MSQIPYHQHQQEGYQNTDLASLLRSLSSSGQVGDPQLSQPQQQQQQQQQSWSQDPGNHYFVNAYSNSSYNEKQWQHNQAQPHIPTSQQFQSFNYSQTVPQQHISESNQGLDIANDPTNLQALLSAAETQPFHASATPEQWSAATSPTPPRQAPLQPPPSEPRSRSPLARSTSVETPTAPPVDSRTITEWTAGLRYVTKLTARNEQIGKSVQKMIKSQHDHERQWAAGREALIQKHEEQEQSQKKVDDVLRALGAQSSGQDNASKFMTNQPSLSSELQLYDQKLYRAATEMVRGMSRELANMRIPFFETSESVLLSDSPTEGGKNEAYSEDDGGGGSSSKKITQRELRELQKKMLRHLEDLYGD